MNKEIEISKAAARMEWWRTKRNEAIGKFTTWEQSFYVCTSPHKEVCGEYMDRYDGIITFCHFRYLATRTELKNILLSC